MTIASDINRHDGDDYITVTDVEARTLSGELYSTVEAIT